MLLPFFAQWLRGTFNSGPSFSFPELFLPLPTSFPQKKVTRVEGAI